MSKNGDSEKLKCPVKPASMWSWAPSLWKTSNTTAVPESCPISHGGSEKVKCPVDDATKEIWLKTHRPASQDVECSLVEIPETPRYRTDVVLPESREVSSIPRTGTDKNWTYPSEKQFYEAMVRKNWNPSAEDMKTVVPIHNSVNERVWNYIKQWESLENAKDIKLTSFKGDSKKLTPRAWIRSTILGYSKPFDRHDWVINRDGKEIDYVIDFYSNDDQDDKVPDIYLDVRPKLNSLDGIKLRVKRVTGL